ncbi:aldehyde dehydrogenase family protein [Azohydromonas australica]|uniref:aldehyde dehydrogenase family protein n=1 Tax=Azohydromonas australica TaxID=364039 RepID=UPI0003F73418|nr:aldehyde dehydrogenase family protein [Azohydromonas australica]
MENIIEIDGIQVSGDHFIGGKRVSSTERFPNHSPIDGHLIGYVAAGLPEHCNAAIEAAQAAFPAWAALGPDKRREHLHRFADELKAWGEKLARVECEDNGMLYARLKGHQIERCAHNISFFADEALKLKEHRIEGRNAKHHVRFDPAGVCVLITPWNSPMMLTTWKLGPALAAGNTVVIKPPEWAPLTCSMLADVAAAAGMPPGVINVVQGIGATTGAALVADPRVARVSFTGSVPTAKTIAKSTGQNLVPASFELGGKSAFIVLEDADLDRAAQTAALQYRNAGQVCLAGTRILVHSKVADDFVARMQKVVAGLRVGDPRDASTEIGPIIHPRQFDKVAGFVDRARDRGARIVWGGAKHEAGDLYYQPTLISDVDQGDEVVQSEIFGPVLVLQRFDSDDEAASMANGTRYGLAGVVFGSEGRALRVAEQLRTGMVWVNSFFLRDLEAPFGGVRDSGIGREGGQWSFEFFCDMKDVMLPQKPYAPVFAGR